LHGGIFFELKAIELPGHRGNKQDGNNDPGTGYPPENHFSNVPTNFKSELLQKEYYFYFI
jgi:hypothetical protein